MSPAADLAAVEVCIDWQANHVRHRNRRYADKINFCRDIVPGTLEPLTDVAQVEAFASEHGYPVAIKASAGGGGRGMRVVNEPSELPALLTQAQQEAERDRLYQQIGKLQVEVDWLKKKTGHLD